MNENDMASLFERIHNLVGDAAAQCNIYHDDGYSREHNARLEWVNQVKRDLARLNDAVNKYDKAVNSL